MELIDALFDMFMEGHSFQMVEHSCIYAQTQVAKIQTIWQHSMIVHVFFLFKILDFFVCVKFLLEHGADPNKKDMLGNTALDIAKEKSKMVTKNKNKFLFHKRL